MPERPNPPNLETWMNDIGRRLRDVERQRLRLPPGADPLQTFENGSPLGDTRFLDFGAGLSARLVGDDYVVVDGSSGGKEYATLVVAASDTHATGKATADFVCTGTNDETTIEAALALLDDETGFTGGEIVLLEGNYSLGGNITITQNGTHFRGMGFGTRLKPTTSAFAIDCRQTDIAISNLAMVGTNNGSGSFTGSGIEGISSATRQIITGCHFINLATGIDHNGSGVLSNCVFNSGVTQADLRVSTGLAWRATNNLLIRSWGTALDIGFGTAMGNVIDSVGGDGGSATIGIRAGGTSGATGGVVGNFLYNPRHVGIQVSSHGAVVGNIIHGIPNNNSGTGIYVVSGTLATICGNIIRDGQIGIHIDIGSSGVVVQGNHVTLCRREGIKLTGSSGTQLTNCTITGNTITFISTETSNTWDGIFLEAHVDKCNIQANTIRRPSGSAGNRYGINIAASTCDDNLVTNNDLSLSGQTGSLNDAGTGTITAAGNRL